MSKASSLSDSSRYEQACDQAIAMCDGNLRSTIKALIMANEYLENELLGIAGGDRLPAACRPDCEQRRRLIDRTAPGSSGS